MITDSTIANDSAGLSGGIYNEGGSLTAVNDTISGNSSTVAGNAGGLITSGAAATLENSIIAVNTAGGVAGDISAINGGSVSPTSGHNLVGTGGSGGLLNGVDGNQVGVADPGLGPLASNGGPTQTMALLSGSPAIDAGSDTLAVALSSGQPLTNDQRGPTFARIFNGTADIGAYELQPALVVAVSVGWGAQYRRAPDRRGRTAPAAGRPEHRPALAGHRRVDDHAQSARDTGRHPDRDLERRGVNYGPGFISGSETSYTITFDPIVKADQVTISIAGAGLTTDTRTLAVLPGDFDDNGVVNNKDVKGIRAEVLGAGGARPTIFGDIYGGGAVNNIDVKAVRRRLGTRLPKLRFEELARPAFRTEAQRLVSLVRLRPDVKSQGAAAAPGRCPGPLRSTRLTLT